MTDRHLIVGTYDFMTLGQHFFFKLQSFKGHHFLALDLIYCGSLLGSASLAREANGTAHLC
jgi:hypothetical protein